MPIRKPFYVVRVDIEIDSEGNRYETESVVKVVHDCLTALDTRDEHNERYRNSFRYYYASQVKPSGGLT